MDTFTGLQRIATVIWWIGSLIAGAIAALGAFFFFSDASDRLSSAALFLGLAIGAYAAGAALAWIVRGFAGPSGSRQ